MASEQATPKRYTYAEYAAIDDGRRYEVYEGELVPMVFGEDPMTGPSLRHQVLSRQIFRALDAWSVAGGGGEVFYAPYDVLLDPAITSVVQPDLIWLSETSRTKLTDAYFDGAPDLVVEVVSPYNQRNDCVRKLNLYERYGVREYWLVYPESDRIEVLARAEEGRFAPSRTFRADEVLTSALLPGFSLPLRPYFDS